MYNGASVMYGYYVNNKIKEKYRNAHYVYCYVHQLYKLDEQVVSNKKNV